MVIKRKVVRKERDNPEILRYLEADQGKAPKRRRTTPWWQLCDHTTEVFGLYYELSERTIFRLQAAGVDLRDVRQVLQAQAEACQRARGPVQHSLRRWCADFEAKVRGREAVLGGM